MLLPTPDQTATKIRTIVHKFRPRLDAFESVYKDVHQHPELSLQETATASIVAKHLKDLGYYVRENIGGHGVAGVLKNGSGPTVLLRAELDALPVLEKTGLPYASKVQMKDADGAIKPVMHACGHDMHLTCLMGAATLLYEARKEWKGSLVLIFQPNEERAGGAQAMIDDELYDKGDVPVPDVVLGQHLVNIRAGYIATRAGYSLSGKNTFGVKVYGRSGHGAEPQRCIDPVMTASYTVVRLQSIISREIDPNSMALITCGSIHAGDAPNIIPDEATIKIDIRAYDPEVLDQVVRSFKRIVEAECEASGVTQKPEINQVEYMPPLINDTEIVEELAQQFKSFFGDMTEEMNKDTASEDFPILAPKGVPYAYWNLGSEDHSTWEKANKEHRLNELPTNHSAKYAPVIEPTLKSGIDALAVAALTFFMKGVTTLPIRLQS